MAYQSSTAKTPKLHRAPAARGAKGDVFASSVAGVASGTVGLCVCLVLFRWCRRRRFYKKVQRTMDEEELAFQKSLAKNYTEEMGAELDDSERERLKLLENYMETMGASLGADEGKEGEANLENVEAFLDQLSKAAAGAEGEEGDMPADLESGGAERAAEGDSGGGGGGAHAPPVEWKEVPPSR